MGLDRSAVTSSAARTLRIEVRFKNAPLYNAIVSATANLHTDKQAQAAQQASGPVAAFCRQYDLTSYEAEAVRRLLTLKIGPTIKKGGKFGHRLHMRPLCMKLSALLDQSIEALFPPALYQHRWPMITRDVDGEMFLSLREAPAESLMLPPSQEDAVMRGELADRVKSVLKTLTPREELVLSLRFGLNDGEEQSLTDVASHFKVSPERVRRIEQRAFRKLRHPRRSKWLGYYVPKILPTVIPTETALPTRGDDRGETPQGLVPPETTDGDTLVYDRWVASFHVPMKDAGLHRMSSDPSRYAPAGAVNPKINKVQKQDDLTNGTMLVLVTIYGSAWRKWQTIEAEEREAAAPV